MDKKLVTVATISALLGASAAATVDAVAATEALLMPKQVNSLQIPIGNAALTNVTNQVRTATGLAASDSLDAFCVTYDRVPGFGVLDIRARQELSVDTTVSPTLKTLPGVTAKP